MAWKGFFMRRVFDSVLQAVGDTPLVRLNRVTNGLKPQIYAKLEFMNPAGSVKDRIGMQIINDAEAKGLLKPGGTIVEATSGNTGMGLAMVAAARGYKCIFVMPDKMSEEKIRALRAFGAQVVITPTAVAPEDPRSYYNVSRKIADETPNAFYANQYHNPQNPMAHYLTTGPEIWEQTDGRIDVLICGLGTGGTVSGTARYLKEKKPDLKVIGVDPVGSLYYDYFKTGAMTEAYSYKVEGIGEDFLPSTMDFSLVDDVVRVNDRECFHMARALVRQEGIYCGGSCGAAVAGAVKWAELNNREELFVVVILPDGASRYLSKVFDDGWMRENRFLEPEIRLGTVRELLESREQAPVATARPSETVSDIINRMKSTGYSQFPVVNDDGKVIGIVHEKRVLQHVLEAPHAAGSPIEGLVDANYCFVDQDTNIAVLSDLFGRARVALVLDGTSIKAVISRIDLIDYMARITR
jgi:cystathionine beta-synthase